MPADFLKGMQISSTSPIDNPKDPSMKQYFAVLDKYGRPTWTSSNIVGMAMFIAVAAFDVATGDSRATSRRQSIIAAMKAMPWIGAARHGRTPLPLQRQRRRHAAVGVLERHQRRDARRGGKAATYTPVGDTRDPRLTPLTTDTGGSGMTAVDVPWIVSVDDHVIEPPSLWTSRLPASVRETGPRVERLPAGELALAGGGTSSARGPTARSSTTGSTKTCTSR